MVTLLVRILWSDLLIFFRRAREWLYPLGFFIIVLSLFPLAMTPDPFLLQTLAPGIIWIAALLASLLALENIFVSDMEAGFIEQLLLNAHPLSLLLTVKIIAHWLVAEMPLILLMPLLGWWFHLSFAVSGMLMITLLLGTPIFSLLGMLGVALTLGLRSQGALLGLLILPLMVPVLVFGVGTVQQYMAGLPVLGNVAFLAGLLLATGCGLPLAIAAALRISLDE
ncbi:MAG: heme exporter protein CcmB [Gammaproteobacteria bacterium RIFCSPHIGHO2_12_FULL_41_20]|nr:MAG: heme exporter protein CcmB [Gammaproteobacteria bacterium RIFCSPHIGHO2_12_FULL_41_20]